MAKLQPDVKWFNCEFYPRIRTGSAVRYEECILPRLASGSVTFFTPWGPRYGWQKRSSKISPGDPELKTLEFLAILWEQIKSGMSNCEVHWLFLGADLYATKVNAFEPEPIAEYFASLQSWLERMLPSADFQLWSDFDQQAEPYRELAKKQIGQLIGLNILTRARQTARVMGGKAEDYLAERLAEAMLIEEIYTPIKISLAPKAKDAQVDHKLPRLYLVPEELQTPWLK